MHLLVVEDDPRLSRLLKRLLEEDRHVVELASDGEEGLEIAEGAPGVECVILDVGLPRLSGVDVARRLRASGRDLAILMLTARDTIGDRVTGLDAGADDYLVKPFAYEELAARLRALTRRSNGSAPMSGRTLRCGPIVRDAVSVDARLLRSTRLRLILWSGGSTLILLALLSSLLYWAVAEKLRSESVDQLTQRATSLQKAAITMQQLPSATPERAFSVKVT